MRHPALTRFFAAFLAVVSAITLLSGGICVKKAADTREKQQRDLTLLSDRLSEAERLDKELGLMRAEYDSMDAAHEKLSADYNSETISFRKDLAIYTATEAGLKQGAEQLEEGVDGLNYGWVAYYRGLEKLDEAEELFRPGYEQFLAGKAALADGWQKLYLAEEYVNSGADIAAQSALIEAGGALSRMLSASMETLENTLRNPPLDEETQEIDRETLAALLAEQSAAILEQLSASEELSAGAQAAFESLVRFVEANAATLQDLVANGFSPEEVQSAIAQQGAELQMQLDGVRQLVGELDGAEDSMNELKAKLESLREGAEEIARGDLSESELVVSLADMLGTTRALLGDVAAALDGAGQLMGMLQDLPGMRAQMEAAQAAIEESEPIMDAALKGFAEGREKLAEAELTLINAGYELEKGKQALAEKQEEQEQTRAELDRRKAEMEKNSRTLAEQKEELALYSEKKDHFSNLRYALLANKGISARVRDGEELLKAAEEEITAEDESMRREYRFRMCAAGLMLGSALFGLLAVVFIFRDRAGTGMHLSAALAALLTAAAEGVSFAAGRGMIYTVIFVGIFSIIVIALNLKKA